MGNGGGDDSSGGMGGSSGNITMSGRERAIETLIDMDPCGATFRGSRLMEEAVPAALAARPNRITNAAALEVAYSLAEHEVSSRQCQLVDSKTTEEAGVAPGMKRDQRDRVLRYHATVLRARVDGGKPARSLVPTSSSGSSSLLDVASTPAVAATPPAQLVAALRRVYGGSSVVDGDAAASALLPELLRAVMGHSIFSENDLKGLAESAAGSKDDTGDTDSTAATSGDGDMKKKPSAESKLSDEKHQEHSTAPSLSANMEKIVGNACQGAVQGSSDDARSVVDGLLIAALSVLTTCMMDDGDEKSEGSLPLEEKQADAHKDEGIKSQQDTSHSVVSPSFPRDSTPTSFLPSDQPRMSQLQVGTVLSLLPNPLTNDVIDRVVGENRDDLILDPSILRYLADAASVYEERIDVRRSRLLAQLRAKQKATASTATKAESSDSSTLSKEEADKKTGEKEAERKESSAGEMETQNTDSGEWKDENAAAAGEDGESGNDTTETTRIEDEAKEETTLTSQTTAAEATPSAESAAADVVADEDSNPRTNDDDDDDHHDDDDDEDDDEDDEEDVFNADDPMHSDVVNRVLIESAARELHDDDDEDDEDEDDDEDDVSGVYSPSQPHEAPEDPHVDEIDDGDEDEDDDNVEDELNRQEDDNEQTEESRRVGTARSGLEERSGTPHEDNEEEGEDAAMLLQALALSLAEHGPSGNAAGKETTSSLTGHGASGASSSASGVPADKGRAGSAERETSGIADENDDSGLPALPVPPSKYPYLEDSKRSGNSRNVNDEKHGTTTDDIGLLLDPNMLTRFGALPARHVVVHLLRCAASIMRLLKAGEKITEEDRSPPQSSCPGGIGSSLFPVNAAARRLIAADDPEAPATSQAQSEFATGSGSLTVHLLVALLQLFMRSRTEKIEKLRLSLTYLSHIKASEEIPVAKDEGKDSPLDETDDPAFATVGGTVVSFGNPLSQSSETLEAKGMRRKAAAAARAATLRQASVEKRVEALRLDVRALSLGCYLCLRCLRQSLRELSQQALVSREESSETSAEQTTPAANPFLISEATRETLSTSLSSFSMPEPAQAQKLAAALVDFDSADRILIPRELCKEAIFVWGEGVPLLFPKHTDREHILFQLIDVVKDSPPSGLISEVPWTAGQESIAKLDALCFRLRFSDMLDGFLNAGSDSLKESSAAETSACPRLYATLSLLREVLPHARATGILPNVEELYLALCHRANIGLIMIGDMSLVTCDSPESLDALGTGGMYNSATGSGMDGNIQLRPQPSVFEFDSTRCSDSIAIPSSSSTNPNGVSAHQRGSKVWGTVLSTVCFHPKTGVHRWAVRLDRCERGHVFIGVSTSQASTKTYVGGDQYGWGVIGTQALWHNRSKVRGDYGATFRTGATVVVTLDSDAGTLSFGLYNDQRQASITDGDASSSQTSSRRSHMGSSGGSGALVEDWGIAFEGLPLDSRLFPAVGLYQRDDRVTLLGVVNRSRSPRIRAKGRRGISAPERPLVESKTIEADGDESAEKESKDVEYSSDQTWNERLFKDGVSYVIDTLCRAIDLLEKSDDEFEDLVAKNEILMSKLLPSVAASICFSSPMFPHLSGRAALALIPLVARCTALLDARVASLQRKTLLCPGMRAGRWIIRATPASPSGTTSNSRSVSTDQYEEYVVQLKDVVNSEDGHGVHGSGIGTTGRSTNGHVTIFGASRGTLLYFVEEWRDSDPEESEGKPLGALQSTSSCVVEARLGLDGDRFDGVYRNVQYGSTGSISGICVPDSKVSNETNIHRYEHMTALLSLAFSHLSAVLCSEVSLEDAKEVAAAIQMSGPIGQSGGNEEEDAAMGRREKMGSLIADSSLLSQGNDEVQQLELVQSLFKDYASSEVSKDDTFTRVFKEWEAAIFARLPESEDQKSSTLDANFQITDEVDKFFVSKAGGRGSLSVLYPQGYMTCRRSIISVMLYHVGLNAKSDLANLSSMSEENKAKYSAVWRAALQIVEAGVRKAISSSSGDGVSRRECCRTQCDVGILVANFLARFPSLGSIMAESTEVLKEIELLFEKIESKEDLKMLQELLNVASCQAFHRYVVLASISTLLSSNQSESSTLMESALLSFSSIVSGDVRMAVNRGRTSNIAHMRSYPSRDDASGLHPKSPQLGAHYMMILAGASCVLQAKFMEIVHDTLKTIGGVIRDELSKYEKDGSSLTPSVSFQSLLLSLISSFILTIRTQDHEQVFGEGRVWTWLQKVILKFRDAVVPESASTGCSDVDGGVGFLVRSLVRHSNRGILRCAVSSLHVLLSQLALQIDHGDKPALSDPLEFLRDEFEHTCGVLVKETERKEGDGEVQLAKSEVEAWSEKCAKVQDGSAGRYRSMGEKSEAASLDISNTGLTYLEEHGSVAPFPMPYASSQSSGAMENMGTAWNNPSQYLTHLLNAIHGVLNSEHFVVAMVGKMNWDSSFLGSIGGLESDSRLPVHQRTRILRMLRHLLPRKSPEKPLVGALFKIAGGFSRGECKMNSSFQGLRAFHTEASLGVAREAVALLRHLYLQRDEWRTSIHEAVSLVVRNWQAKSSEPSESAKGVGVMAFLGGLPGRITTGSYVLLRPSSAASLSSPSSGSSSKSHGGSSSGSSGSGPTVPVMIGGGVEGIVAGLCRKEAMAGMVSSVDASAGTCEVILCDRQYLAKAHSGTATFVSAGRPGHLVSMTVRAVRAFLSDVAAAEEVPLSLGVDFPFHESLLPLMESAAEEAASTLEKARDAASVQEENSGLDSRVFILRSVSVLVSSPRLVKQMLAHESSRKSLRSVLKLAALLTGEHPNRAVRDACGDGLSALPEWEARYWYYCRLLANVACRKRAVKGLSEIQWDEVWKVQDREDEKKLEVDTATEKDTTSDDTQGYTTPPPTTTSGDSGNTENRASTENTESESHVPGRVDRTTSTGTTSSASAAEQEEENDEDDEAARAAEETAAAHLREAAIVQMAELGLPRSWSELALRRTGGTDIVAAVQFCLERDGDMERLIAEERERERRSSSSGSGSSSRRRAAEDTTSMSSHQISQLVEMGFPDRWCREALAATGNNVDEALTWILTNSDRLNAQDEGEEEEDDEEEDDDDEEEEEDDEEEEEEEDDDADDNDEEGGTEGTTGAYSGDEAAEGRASSVSASEHGGANPDPTMSGEKAGETSKQEDSEPGDEGTKSETGWRKDVICPLRSVSGRSAIKPETLEVSGLPNGGFSSVGTKGVPLMTGKWYYEAVLITAGCLQIGWADSSFAGHCQADRGDGCGDGPSSWAYDGWRRYRWHSSATEWGCRWEEGDVVGCLVDMDKKKVSFTLNGQGEEIGMGAAFSGAGFRPCGGVYACVSFNRRERLRLILGGNGSEPFKHAPPEGYRGVGEAVYEAVDERSLLIKEEEPLLKPDVSVGEAPKRYLCDFSDGEHGHELFAWHHRYYGSDASVHLGSGSRSSGRSGSRSSGRSGSDGRRGGSGSSILASDEIADMVISGRLIKCWEEDAKKAEAATGDGSAETTEAENNSGGEKAKWSATEVAKRLEAAYDAVSDGIKSELVSICLVLDLMYARKLVLHFMIASSSDFSVGDLVSPDNQDDSELSAGRCLWNVIQTCCSLQSAGWVGEAGAMAVAAEALGLGISSHDLNSPGSEKPGVTSSLSIEGESTVPIAAGGITQFLSSVLILKPSVRLPSGVDDMSAGLVACAEAALGGEGGGSLAFLRSGLHKAVIDSAALRKVLIAAVRRSVRLLSAVEYGGEDAVASTQNESSESTEDQDSEPLKGEQESNSKEPASLDSTPPPDARLALFLTGLLLSAPVSDSSCPSISDHLLEAWSIGLLSASAPWRMVCALTTTSILNLFPTSLNFVTSRLPTLQRLFGRLNGTVSRRMWAERAAVPVCSRYVQAYIDLLSSAFSSQAKVDGSIAEVGTLLSGVEVDAATPLPLPMGPSDCFCEEKVEMTNLPSSDMCWEWDDGRVMCDNGWEIMTGTVTCEALNWTSPSRSAVRTLMDEGEGPPMLRAGCRVMRGLDWEEQGSGAEDKNEDGKEEYDKEKVARDKEVRKGEDDEEDDKKEQGEKNASTDASSDKESSTSEKEKAEEGDDGNSARQGESDSEKAPESADDGERGDEGSQDMAQKAKKKDKKKVPHPKLPLGTILSIEPWKGCPGLGRRVRWHRTGKEGVYRYGGDGGRYDIGHVEVNDKETRIKKRHPLPESAEQCASRCGFGPPRRYNVLLRLRRHDDQFETDENRISKKARTRKGIMEWPDFGAGVAVEVVSNDDQSVSVTEKELLFGSKDSGWEARFGQPSYAPGSVTRLIASQSEGDELDGLCASAIDFEELRGSNESVAVSLRNRGDGGEVKMKAEMKLLRRRQEVPASPEVPSSPAALLPHFSFDPDWHASSMSLSRDRRTVSCVTSDGRGTAFADVGFTKGVHYWEVKLEQADIGSVFIGVAEKPNFSHGGSGSSFGFDSQSRLNRWHGWGFVNFRATYTASPPSERVYGAHCHSGDTVGVLLDCDAGRVSFFFDGVNYGEHILNDLGCAFENISPFGFNADGCGSGGGGQGAPSGSDGGRSGRYPSNGAVRPKALWPVIGLRNPGDRVTISGKWTTSLGVDGVSSLRNVLRVDEVLRSYKNTETKGKVMPSILPRWFLKECFVEYERWRKDRWHRVATRGSGPQPLTSFGLDVDLDTTPLACATACAALGLTFVLLPNDRVSVKRSAGRLLELAEEAIVLGAHQGRLYYRIVTQKSEGGSLVEGGGRAWFWDESEVVDDGVKLLNDGGGLSIEMPLLQRFKCNSPGGLRVVYPGGAVIRSDLEIFDGSANIGKISHHSIIPQEDVLERRVNSCGVVRFRVRYESVGEGWISSRIRGGNEEAIVEPVSAVEGAATEKKEEVVEEEALTGKSFLSPFDVACDWLGKYEEELKKRQKTTTAAVENEFAIRSLVEFEDLVAKGGFAGRTMLESDSLLAMAMSAISDASRGGDLVNTPFSEVAAALKHVAEGRKEKGSSELPTCKAAVEFISKEKLSLPSVEAVLARISVLRALNRRARAALPWLSLRPPQEGSAILGGLNGYGAAVDRAGRSRVFNAEQSWILAPSIATRLRACKNLIFSSVKRLFFEGVMNATTTPTPLSHDEYELPREVRTVRVNRLKARRAMASDDSVSKRKHSVFAQLQHEMRGWSGAALRRGHIAKGHGGQKRAFKVKLVGEGVNDYSGPYRETFTDALGEITEVDGRGRSSLGVLDPSPNNVAEVGEDRSLYVFASNGKTEDDTQPENDGNVDLTLDERVVRSCFSSLIIDRNEGTRETEEALIFLGRLVGTACRHGIPVDLPLPLMMVWKALVEEATTTTEVLRETDIFSCRFAEEKGGELTAGSSPQRFVAMQQRMLNAFAEGLASVVPTEVCAIFTGEELRDIVCGNPDIDVDLLHRVVEYEGFKEEDPVIGYFWEVLEEMSPRERKLFLQFVWARNRLPMRESDFDAPFKIQRDVKSKGSNSDLTLPSASTCFFSLALPEYTKKDILREKLLFAIENVFTMESDYVTNEAEISEGWRGL